MLNLLTFSDEALCQEFLTHLDTEPTSTEPNVQTRSCQPEEAAEEIHCHLSQTGTERCGSEQRRVVLVSDLLAKHREPSDFTQQLVSRFSQRELALLAVTPYGRRCPEIDRSIARSCKPEHLQEALAVLRQRLDYLASPTRTANPAPVAVREVRLQWELFAYFRLRHRIYRVMGYLSDEIERCRSRLEIDSCDRKSIHIGAFTSDPITRKETLVGTVRLIVPGRRKCEISEHVMALASDDPELKNQVRRAELPLCLPIFQSNELDDLIIEQFSDSGPRSCELSRLIVDTPHRGRGVSVQLMNAAIERARHEPIDRILLECLDVHVGFYERFGFQRIEGKSGRVIGIGRTMVPMLLDLRSECAGSAAH